ncbi:hypothetical protein WEI85_06050 [Actinomycetes bacterium KLBMP 9797]
MSATEVWLQGGPADGRIQLVELDARGCLPATLVLPQTNFYIGTSDEPVPTVDHVYRRTDDLDGQPIYQYQRSP